MYVFGELGHIIASAKSYRAPNRAYSKSTCIPYIYLCISWVEGLSNYTWPHVSHSRSSILCIHILILVSRKFWKIGNSNSLSLHGQSGCPEWIASRSDDCRPSSWVDDLKNAFYIPLSPFHHSEYCENSIQKYAFFRARGMHYGVVWGMGMVHMPFYLRTAIGPAKIYALWESMPLWGYAFMEIRL